MTWAFVYIAALIVGLVLAGVTVLLRDLRPLARRHLVFPHADHHASFFAVVGPRIASALLGFALVGLVLKAQHWFDAITTAELAGGAGGAACLLSAFWPRRRCAPDLPAARAVVVREMPPGGYGQVRVDSSGGAIVMAAQSIDTQVLPEGMVVEVVDCTRSVLTVRRSLPG
ncbi:MAG: hypothetical protein ACHQQS_02725 [Thermoanaerobaculales bacterium]